MRSNDNFQSVISGTIESTANPKIKAVKKLYDSASERKEQGLFVIQTNKIVKYAFENKIKIQSIFITEKEFEKNIEFIYLYKQSQGEVYVISESVNQKISDLKTPQGFFALCEIPQKNHFIIDKFKTEDIIIRSGKYIALENIQDPGNMGTIIRSALALGFDGIILNNNCVDLYSPKTIRSTMGASFTYNILLSEDFSQILNIFQQGGFILYGTFLDDNARKLGTFEFAQKSVVVIGNESTGITHEIKAICDEKIIIPMDPIGGQIQSLNAASAASVVMWECIRNK